MTDRYERIRAVITFCDKCGCDWLDNGLHPVSCPYCRIRELRAERDQLAAEIEALRAEVDALAKDAAKYRWGINNARWIRSEQEAYVAIPVAPDADLSCVAMRDAAIDAALSKENSDARAALAKAEGR